VEGSCERGNEPPGSIKFWEVLDKAAQLATSLEGLSTTKPVSAFDYKVFHECEAVGGDEAGKSRLTFLALIPFLQEPLVVATELRL
jgi:hypothetical protein